MITAAAGANTSRGGVAASSSSFGSTSFFSLAAAAAARKHRSYRRQRGRTQRLNVSHEQQHDKSDSAEQQSPPSSSSNSSSLTNPGSSAKDAFGVDDLDARFRESKRKSKPNMPNEDMEEALQQMRGLFIQYPKEGKVVNELVKQLKNCSRRDMNRNNDAIKEALKALEVHSESIVEENVSSGTLTTWAVLLEQERNYKLAREKFALACAMDSKNFAAPHAWGMMEQRRGNFDKARKLLTKSLEIAPRSTTYNALANLENRVGDKKQARKYYEKSIEKHSGQNGKSSSSGYTQFALFETSCGNFDKAEELFERGWALLESSKSSSSSSESVYLLTSWADLLSKRMLMQQNQSKFEVDGVVNGRNSSSKISNSDSSDHIRKVFEESVCEKFRLAAKLNPGRAETYTSWSLSERAFASKFNSYDNTKRSVTSREHDVITEGIRRCPGESKLYLAEAMYLRRENRTEEALEKLEALSKRSFGNSLDAGMFDPHVWHALGMCKSDLFDFEGAVEAFERGSRARKDGILNLPCITAEAHAEFINGNVGRARQLFILGRDECMQQKRVPPSARATRRERSTHNRLWALLEKRAGTEDATRALFAAAVKEDRSDATAWMQWGQWEKRVQGPEIARDMFRNGLKGGTTRLSGFLYQAWALLEQECGNDDVARELFSDGCKACSNFAELWHGYAAFEANCGNYSRALEIVAEAEFNGVRAHEPLMQLAADLLRLSGDIEGANQRVRELDDMFNANRDLENPGREVIL